MSECDVSPDCLKCPLEFCKHDNPTEYQALIRRQEDGKKLKAMEGLTNQEAAAKLGITVRTVFRIKQRG